MSIPLAKKHKQIGVAVIWDRDRHKILIDQRLPQGDFGGYWEFPGGKIEEGEDAIACIRREIREELGIDIEVGAQLIAVSHEYEKFIVSLIVHHCHHISGEPQAIECAEIRWVEISELENYRLPEANYQIVAALKGI
ncbi:Mutator MutT protein [Tumidithrix helvetica PCC 7403]|uniref:8-oxo-dGTP diphosphatase MutT n=1 Tax=Tumidithrix helvetica TaxID=3457545 RepID=UPI003CA31EF5